MSTIMLASGRYFDLRAPESCEIKIADIAHALSNICRFTGHTREFYSVAQHSVLVSLAVPRVHAFAALLHDAAEAFVTDVSAPLKALLPDYKRLEKQVQAAVFAHFGLPPELPDCVKKADLVLLRTEQRDLMGAGADEWSVTRGIELLPDRIVPLPPHRAKHAFMARFDQVAP